MKGFSPFSSLFFSDDNYVSLRENKPTDNQTLHHFYVELDEGRIVEVSYRKLAL